MGEAAFLSPRNSHRSWEEEDRGLVGMGRVPEGITGPQLGGWEERWECPGSGHGAQKPKMGGAGEVWGLICCGFLQGTSCYKLLKPWVWGALWWQESLGSLQLQKNGHLLPSRETGSRADGVERS